MNIIEPFYERSNGPMNCGFLIVELKETTLP